MPNDLATRQAPTRDAGIPSNLTGTIPGGYDPAYGGVPVIPDPIASAWKALGGDQAMLEQIFGLGNQYNQFNYGQHMGQIAGTPSYGNVTDLMAGKLPQDVMAQLNQGSAERGTGLGLDPNSPNVNSAYLRSLGLSSLDAQKLGQQEFGALSGLFPQAAPFNPSSFFTSPEDIQAASAAANVSAAAPNPRAAAMEEERKMLEALAAGHSALPPTIAQGGPAGPSGLLNGPSGQGPQTAVGSGPSQTINRGTTGTTSPSSSFTPTWWDSLTNAIQSGGSSPSNIDAMTQSIRGPGPTQGTPWPGGGVVNPTDQMANWWQSSDPWATMGNIDWGAPTDQGQMGQMQDWWSDPSNDFGYFPGEEGYQPTYTGQSSDWWNAPDPWSGLTGQDWGAGLDLGNGGYDIPDWAALPGEDYYGG